MLTESQQLDERNHFLMKEIILNLFAKKELDANSRNFALSTIPISGEANSALSFSENQTAFQQDIDRENREAYQMKTQMGNAW